METNLLNPQKPHMLLGLPEFAQNFLRLGGILETLEVRNKEAIQRHLSYVDFLVSAKSLLRVMSGTCLLWAFFSGGLGIAVFLLSMVVFFTHVIKRYSRRYWWQCILTAFTALIWIPVINIDTFSVLSLCSKRICYYPGCNYY